MTGGSIRSHPEFDISIDGKVVDTSVTPNILTSLTASFEGTGNDYIRNDPDAKRMRLGAHAVAR